MNKDDRNLWLTLLGMAILMGALYVGLDALWPLP